MCRILNVNVWKHVVAIGLLSATALGVDERLPKDDARPIIPEQLRTILPWTQGKDPVTWIEQDLGEQTLMLVLAPHVGEEQRTLDLVGMFVFDKTNGGIRHIEPVDLARMVYGEKELEERRRQAETVSEGEEGAVAATDGSTCWANGFNGATCLYWRGSKLCMVVVCCRISSDGTTCQIVYNECFTVK